MDFNYLFYYIYFSIQATVILLHLLLPNLSNPPHWPSWKLHRESRSYSIFPLPFPLSREAQVVKDRIREKLSAQQQEHTINEELLISKAVAEQEAKRVQQQREEDEGRAAMLDSITTHREAIVKHAALENIHWDAVFDEDYRTYAAITCKHFLFLNLKLQCVRILITDFLF